MTLGIALLGTGGIAQRSFAPAVNAVDDAQSDTPRRAGGLMSRAASKAAGAMVSV